LLGINPLMPRHRKGGDGRWRQRMRLARSLMVTPWLAAGVGMMIAAAVAVNSPPALTYGPAAPGLRCPAGGCTGQGHQPGLAAASPGAVLRDPGPDAGGTAAARAGARRGAAAASGSDRRLEYQIVTRRRKSFLVIITLPGDLKPGSWRLQFGFPAARIDRVWGAAWQPSGNGRAGMALGPGEWLHRPPGEPGANQLAVRAAGTPTAPSGCRLDGLRCSFSRRAAA
jgi:hypothetical protein